MRPHRRLMDPSTLEMLLMLRLNKDMWSEKTVQDIIDDDFALKLRRKRRPKAHDGEEDDDMFEQRNNQKQAQYINK